MLWRKKASPVLAGPRRSQHPLVVSKNDQASSPLWEVSPGRTSTIDISGLQY